ncbi:MAG: type II toxin-antitoxin system HicB family antitoxin [Planctomycetes bacterium]|nr:type II toxin-antitoxin system HicB family antitoxin [Planctomycetota bacterium]
MRFLVTIVYDPEFEGYVADVPELPGCMSQGKTVEETLENVKEAIGLFLDHSPVPRERVGGFPLTTVVEI